uniref:ST3 beta-galactoside alpha-2,3-sialyltransferase 1 n=1 Tax=Neolamprologus brichardi TaxID=32507 RepID=A0A3Q4I9F6_NEOBR
MYFKRGKCRVHISSLLNITAIVLVSILLWNLSGYTFCHQESRLCACHKCLTDSDPWFNYIISESPKPFMSQKHKPSEEDFDWWKLYTPIASVIALARSDWADKGCLNTANSSASTGHNYRLTDPPLNRGRTKGFERDVGTKTTYHVMYPESATRLDNTTHLLFFPFKTPDFLWLLKSLIPGEGNWSHYFEILKNKRIKTGGHPGEEEYKMIVKLHMKKKIVFFKGW